MSEWGESTLGGYVSIFHGSEAPIRRRKSILAGDAARNRPLVPANGRAATRRHVMSQYTRLKCNIIVPMIVIFTEDDLCPWLPRLVYGALLGLAIRCKLDAAGRPGVGQRRVYFTWFLALLLHRVGHRSRRRRFPGHWNRRSGVPIGCCALSHWRHRHRDSFRSRGLLTSFVPPAFRDALNTHEPGEVCTRAYDPSMRRAVPLRIFLPLFRRQ